MFTKSKVKIIPLGGLDEIGKNLTVFEYEDEIIVVDCGVAFPEDDFRGFEKLLIQDVVISLYKIILSNPVSLVIALAKTKMVKPETIKGFADNITRLCAGFETFNKELKDSVEEKRDAFYIVFSNEDNREAYRNYIMFLKTLTPVFQHAVKVEKLCQDKRIDDAEFLKFRESLFEILNNKSITLKEKIQKFLSYSKFDFPEFFKTMEKTGWDIVSAKIGRKYSPKN